MLQRAFKAVLPAVAALLILTGCQGGAGLLPPQPAPEPAASQEEQPAAAEPMLPEPEAATEEPEPIEATEPVLLELEAATEEPEPIEAAESLPEATEPAEPASAPTVAAEVGAARLEALAAQLEAAAERFEASAAQGEAAADQLEAAAALLEKPTPPPPPQPDFDLFASLGKLLAPVAPSTRPAPPAEPEPADAAEPEAEEGVEEADTQETAPEPEPVTQGLVQPPTLGDIPELPLVEPPPPPEPVVEEAPEAEPEPPAAVTVAPEPETPPVQEVEVAPIISAPPPPLPQLEPAQVLIYPFNQPPHNDRADRERLLAVFRAQMLKSRPGLGGDFFEGHGPALLNPRIAVGGESLEELGFTHVVTGNLQLGKKGFLGMELYATPETDFSWITGVPVKKERDLPQAAEKLLTRLLKRLGDRSIRVYVYAFPEEGPDRPMVEEEELGAPLDDPDGMLSTAQLPVELSPELKMATELPNLLYPLSPSTKPVWTVQVGAFTQEGNALFLMENLRKKGVKAYTRKVTIPSGRSFTVVRFGPFPNRLIARSARDAFTKKWKMTAAIAPETAPNEP